MKIKRKDLRKGLAQLPINYPAPTVEDVFDFEREKHRVEDICKKLAHVEVEVRDAALSEIPRYLGEVAETFATSKGSVAPADLELLFQKLCMGLFYCFWHSDKPLVQHECAFKISQLVRAFPMPSTIGKAALDKRNRIAVAAASASSSSSSAAQLGPDATPEEKAAAILAKKIEKQQKKAAAAAVATASAAICPYMTAQRLFVESLFRILAREWSRIDHYRIDKYMSLTRKTLYQLLIVVKKYYEAGLEREGKILEEEEAGEDGESDNAAGTSSSTNANTNKASVTKLSSLTAAQKKNIVEQNSLNYSPFIAGLKTFFQTVLLVEPRNVGLTMHMMDIVLDEFIRSDVDVAMFVHLSEMVPLFAMSKGDFIEKRVLDHFVGPIVSGVLDSRRVATIATSPEEIKARALKKNKRSSSTTSTDDNTNGTVAERDYSDENDQICLRLAAACKALSVDKGTRHTVRPLLSESQMLFEQRLAVKLNPTQFRRLTHRDMRRRITKELQEAEESVDKTMKFRKIVKDERRDAKQKARRLVGRFGGSGEEGGEVKGVALLRGKKQMKKETIAKKDNKKKRIVIEEGSAAAAADGDKTKPKPNKKKLSPTAAVKLSHKISSSKNIDGKVKEEVKKLARKEFKKQAKDARLEGGESESKLSSKGISQNSKRHKYTKLTKADIAEMESMPTPVWKKKK